MSKLGQHEEAIAAYDQALEIRSDKHKTLYAKGYVLCHLRRYKEAIAIFNQALMIKPCEWETLYIKGNALFELGQYEEAISEYEKILAIKSDSHEAFYSKGNALYALEQREKAIAAYNQALEIKPDRQDALTNKSNVLSDLGQYKEAIDTCNQALVFKHDNSAALINKGRALLNLKFWEEAIASLDQALTIKPDLWQAWINRGSASGGSAQCKTTVFLSLPLAMQTSHLDKRGYEGQLASYEEGLKYVQQGSESEGWGKLHWATGRVHYSQGQFDFNFRNYLHKAIKSYQTALIALTLIDFPKAYLEVISELLRAYLGLGNTETAKELRLQGLEVFRDLLNAAPSLVQKRQLEVKFSGFSQVAVDSLVQEGEITAGLEAAERYKNRALSWILEEWKEQVWSPDYEQMQSLLDNSTAVVYWHLSPDALTTFVLKPHATAPILISAQPADAEALERKSLPESWQRFRKFETWVKDWNQQYADYGGKGGGKGKENGKSAQPDQHTDPKTHPWRVGLKQNLERLREILGIEAIEAEILKSATGASQQAEITQLMLIPHRDLHRFPLHALFSERFTVTYLPSLQVGLSLRQRKYVPIQSDSALLSVEFPASNQGADLPYARIESAAIAQLFHAPTRVAKNEATYSQVKAYLEQNHSVFHFTGHGAHDAYQPQNSDLLLADGDRLTAEAVRKLNLSHYTLVCLAACETAVTKDQMLDVEYVGLVSAFLQAGAAQVVSTFWTVEDISSAYLMIRFYQLLLSGNVPAVALKQARQWLQTVTCKQLANWLNDLLTSQGDRWVAERLSSRIRNLQKDSSKMNSNEPLYANPYYWAAFALAGRATL
ncbi:MAG: CHAT domain-containing protein [Leptolyngbyaceae cyanobacterium SM1_4_3]|nr:CHAT domain-containing protein [Leptolyngbyaceae cyanobacterium SM1_4_3]